MRDRGDGRERSSSAAKGPGLKPAWIVGLYAALKRRSSTSLQAGCIGPFGKLRPGSSLGVARFACDSASSADENPSRFLTGLSARFGMTSLG
jgi:hypothetical protein